VFQQDGARCHNARITTQWLEANINARMICSLQSQQDVRLGHQPFLFEWPPYSPDMSPMDFGNKIFFFRLMRFFHICSCKPVIFVVIVVVIIAMITTSITTKIASFIFF
jgi:hypothetical protein